MKNSTLFASLFAAFSVLCFGNSALAFAAQALTPATITSAVMPIATSTTLYVTTNPADQDTCYIVVSTSPANSLIPTTYAPAISCVKTSGPAQANLPPATGPNRAG